MTASSLAKVDIANDLVARRYLLSHPDIFIEHYSGLRLKTFHRRIIYAVHLNPRICILLPAGHGKSTLISKWYTIFCIAQNPNIRLILIMKSDEEVSFYAKSIRRELAGNHALIRDWGPFVPRGRDAVWSNDAIEVAQRQITEPQPTIEFASAKSIDQVLGHRCDKYLGDDIVTPKTVNTEELREKQKVDFNMGIDTGPQPLWDLDDNGQWINKPEHIFWPEAKDYPPGLAPVYWSGGLIGTVFHPEDLLHEKGRSPIDLVPGKMYRGNADGWKMMYYDCFEHDPETNVPLEDKPIWPERWVAGPRVPGKESLSEKRAQGEKEFNCRYRNIAVADSDLTFKRWWIKGTDDGEFPGCLNRRRSLSELPKHENPLWVVAQGLDPSTGRKKKGSTWSSYLVLASDLNEAQHKRYLLDLERGQLGFDDILKNLYDFHTGYGCTLSVVEQNAAQKWLLDNHTVQGWIMNEKLRIIGHETQAGNKNDPVMGVMSMDAMVKNGWLDIPYQTPEDRDKVGPFLDQLYMFPQGVFDWVMALWFAHLGIGDQRRKYRSWARPGASRTITLPSARR